MAGPTQWDMTEIRDLLMKQNELLEDIADGVDKFINSHALLTIPNGLTASGVAEHMAQHTWSRPSKRKEGE